MAMAKKMTKKEIKWHEKVTVHGYKVKKFAHLKKGAAKDPVKDPKLGSLRWGEDEDDFDKLMTLLMKTLDESLLDSLLSMPRECNDLIPPEYLEILLGKSLLSSSIELAKSIMRFTASRPNFSEVKVTNRFFDDLYVRHKRQVQTPDLLMLSLVRKGDVEIVRFALDNSPKDFNLNNVLLRDGDMLSNQWLDKELDEMSAEETFEMNDSMAKTRINKAEYEVETMLSAALKLGSLDMVRVLLNRGADPFVSDFQAFKVAARLGQVEEIKAMISMKKVRYTEQRKTISNKEYYKIFSICLAFASLESRENVVKWLDQSIRQESGVKFPKVFKKAVNMMVADGASEFCCSRHRLASGISFALAQKDKLFAPTQRSSNRDSIGSVSSIDSFSPAEFIKLDSLYKWFEFVTRGNDFNALQILLDLFYFGLDKFFQSKKRKTEEDNGDRASDRFSLDEFSQSDASSSAGTGSDDATSESGSIVSRGSILFRKKSLNVAATLKTVANTFAPSKNVRASSMQKFEAIGMAAEFGNPIILNKLIDTILPKVGKMVQYLKIAAKKNRRETAEVLLDRIAIQVDEFKEQEVKEIEKRMNKKMQRKKSSMFKEVNRKKSLREMSTEANKPKPGVNLAKMTLRSRPPKEMFRMAIIEELTNQQNQSNQKTEKNKNMKVSKKKSFGSTGSSTSAGSRKRQLRRGNSLSKKNSLGNKRSNSRKNVLVRVRSSLAMGKSPISDEFPEDVVDLYRYYLTELLKTALDNKYKSYDFAELLVGRRYCNTLEAEALIMNLLTKAVTRRSLKLSTIRINYLVRMLAVRIPENRKVQKEPAKLNLRSHGRKLARAAADSVTEDVQQLQFILEEMCKYTETRIILVEDLNNVVTTERDQDNNWQAWGEYLYLMYEHMEPNEREKLKNIEYSTVASINLDARRAWDKIISSV